MQLFYDNCYGDYMYVLLSVELSLTTVRVENFEGVNFRAIQYSVLFGKFRG